MKLSLPSQEASCGAAAWYAPREVMVYTQPLYHRIKELRLRFSFGLNPDKHGLM